MNDRDNGQRSNAIRMSIDGFTAALSPRKRHFFAPNQHPHPHLDPDPPDEVLPDGQKHHKGIMSFFSRFGSKNRSSLHVNTKRHSKTADSGAVSVPATPVTPGSATTIKHSVSTSALQPVDDVYEQRSAETFPLCVAYIQAIKCANLPACTLPSETILKRIADKDKLAPKDRRSRVLQRSHASTKSADLEWTRKMFVLYPGFLLQYTGNGTEDRIPEKLLQITASTLAFASDVIPGRPWVLLVYRSASGEDGVLVPEKRATFLGKGHSKGAQKGSATAFIMVFESAEEMDCWMGMIRGEASRLGGGSGLSSELVRELDSSEDSPASEETTRRLYGHDDEHDIRIGTVVQGDISKNEGSSSDENNSKRTSTYYRSSTDATRSVTTAVSGDQIVLDQLRSSSRMSHRSNGKARISACSPDTSPDRSSIATNTKDRRKSAALSTRSRSSVDLRQQRPLSTIDKDGNVHYLPRTPSPSAPNFSLPMSTIAPHNGHRRPLSTSVVPPVPNSLTPSHMAPTFSVTTADATETSNSRPRSQPTVTSRGSSTTSKSKHSPTSKRRPVSMVDSSRAYSYHHVNAHNSLTPGKRTSLPPPPLINVPIRNRSLRRPSLTALSIPPEESAAAAGPAPHPPPNIPLPELPPDANERHIMRHSPGSTRKSRRGSNDRPRIGKRQSFQTTPNEEMMPKNLASPHFSLGSGKEAIPRSATVAEDTPTATHRLSAYTSNGGQIYTDGMI